MNDGQLKTDDVEKENLILSIDIKNKISSVNIELSNQVNTGIEQARMEYTEINRLFEEITRNTTIALGFSQTLEDYIKKISIIIVLTPIFQRIQSYCDFVDNALLVPIKDSLEKINSICDYKLDNEQAWEVVQPYLGNFVEDTAYLEATKIELNKLYKYLQDKMEWFALSYKAASWESKRNFFSKLNEDPQLLSWTQPFIEIAEGRETSWETALIKAMDSLSETPLIIEKRVFE